VNLRTVSRTTRLGAPAAAVWERAATLEGVNAELRPILRMTAPRHLRGATLADLEPGVPAGRSWLLLGGLLPVDYDDLCLTEIDPPRRFLERSRMLSMSSWQHERIVEPLDGATCSLTDTLSFELRSGLARLPGVGALSQRIVEALFRHRHRRLVAMHGSAAPR
jgi:ligand-binding SRPBCC domain-containing protein